MPRKPDRDGNYVAPSTMHYNIKCVGGVLLNRVSARYFTELRPEVIEWVWIVEQRREATKQEIKNVCFEMMSQSLSTL